MKRAIDTIIALLLLPIALGVCIPVCMLIRLETPGAPLFWQTRVGRDQRPFRLLKLRTMEKGTPQAGSHEIASAQITRIGIFLRRTKIDELPQIWNVLTGAMSFVGPRPSLPNQHELIAERFNRGVYKVRPGITGPAQLAGIDMSTPAKLAQADADYIATRSLRKDINLIFRTATGAGGGDAANKA